MNRDLGPPGGRDGEGRATPSPATVEQSDNCTAYARQPNPQDNRIEAFDESAARQLDNDIRALARHVHIALEALMVLVAEAQANNIHTLLGFPSWTAYLADALDGQWRIERDKRGEVVRFLADQGMSSRAIAKITGIGKGTVYRELAGAPLGQVVTGLDGKTYTRPEPPDEPDEESDEEFLARMEAERWIITIPRTVEELVTRGRQIIEDERRLERIKFEMAFAAVAKQPAGVLRDAREVGLHMRWQRTNIHMRWQRTNILWLMEDGQSIENIAEHFGVSVEMVMDYLDAPTSSNDGFLAAVCSPPQPACRPETQP
jgi:transposase